MSVYSSQSFIYTPPFKIRPAKTHGILFKVWNPKRKKKKNSLTICSSLDCNRSINASFLVWANCSAQQWFDGFRVRGYPLMLWEPQSGSVSEWWLTCCHKAHRHRCWQGILFVQIHTYMENMWIHTCTLADKTSIQCETPYGALPAIFHIMRHFLPSSVAVSPFKTDIDMETVLTVK